MMIDEPCSMCGGSSWWRRGADWLCGRCHPDPRTFVVEPTPAYLKGWRPRARRGRIKDLHYDDGQGDE